MKLLTVFLLIALVVQLTAQHEFHHPRSASMGVITTVQEEEYALFANPAGIANLERWNLGTFYHQAFGLSELTSLAIGLTIPGRIPLGLTFQQFGRGHLKDQRIGLAMAHDFGPISLGLASYYRLLSIPGYARDQAMTWDFGILVPLSPKFHMGFLLQNLSRTKIFQSEKLITAIRFGARYLFHQYLMIAIEISHTLGYDWSSKAGLEYVIKGKIPVRSGINLLRKTAHAGIGFLQGNWTIDYGLDLHIHLGTSHRAALYIRWN
ncbi:MAG: hypothetical protein OER04_18515 [Cyclobacteriaceae bacterium]|nr:hypothetical protein [Cyclobacteriaceae bacterium]